MLIQIIGISLYIPGTAALSKLKYRYIVYSCTGERFKMAKWPNPSNRGGQATGGRNWVGTDLKGSGWSVGENLEEAFFSFLEKTFFQIFRGQQRVLRERHGVHENHTGSAW